MSVEAQVFKKQEEFSDHLKNIIVDAVCVLLQTMHWEMDEGLGKSIVDELIKTKSLGGRIGLDSFSLNWLGDDCLLLALARGRLEYLGRRRRQMAAIRRARKAGLVVEITHDGGFLELLYLRCWGETTLSLGLSRTGGA